MVIGRLGEGEEPCVDEGGSAFADAIYFELRDERHQPLDPTQVQVIQLLL